MTKVLIISGEASGDLHGANLARALKELDPAVTLVGVGGAAMKAAGVRLVEGFGHLDIMGMIGLSALRAVIKRFAAMRRLLRSEPWDAVVFIDNPGLNLRYAWFAKAAGLRVIYYIAPQVWAWRPGRMKYIQQRVDHVMVILPFEPELYHRVGLPCTFVGHPLLDAVAPHYDRPSLRVRFRLKSGGTVVALLPGSRAREVQSLLPTLLEAAERLARDRPDTQFILAQASTISDDLLQPLLQQSAVPVTVVKEQASEVMAVSDLVLVASGTATLQAAVVGTPMVLLYRTDRLTYRLARLLIRVQWIGLVNLVAGRSVVPELIQDEATGERLYEEARRLLEDRAAYDEMKRALAAVKASLGEPGASSRAAQVVLNACRA
ncbi:lipid-A-disaccharide synthase [Nitrospira sp. NS4]|uniref:lipid-A-disaccharide synthase n=1 Tax=Nitrospira sp. NS4 TaxID=3414498 RepID=UPI003C2F500D